MSARGKRSMGNWKPECTIYAPVTQSSDFDQDHITEIIKETINSTTNSIQAYKAGRHILESLRSLKQLVVTYISQADANRQMRQDERQKQTNDLEPLDKQLKTLLQEMKTLDFGKQSIPITSNDEEGREIADIYTELERFEANAEATVEFCNMPDWKCNAIIHRRTKRSKHNASSIPSAVQAFLNGP